MGARKPISRFVLGVCSVMVVFVFSSAVALAEVGHPFVSSFGSFKNVQGVAVEEASGDVFVYDGGAGTISKFDSSGAPLEFASTKTNSIKVPTASGAEAEIAVSSAGQTKGDIYFAPASRSGVQIFNAAGEQVGELKEEAGRPWGEACGVAVDPSGNVYVGLYREDVNKYTPTGTYVGSLSGVEGVCNVAADSMGNVFVDTWQDGPVTKYEALQFGALAASGTVIDGAGSTLAVDESSNEVYVDQRGEIVQYTSTGELAGEFGLGGPGALNGDSVGIAVDGKTHEIYASDGSGHVSIFGPAVVLPEVTTGAVSNLVQTNVTLQGAVNPSGLEVSSCQFEWGTEPGVYPNKVACSQAPGAGNTAVAVTAELTGLTAATGYHYRLVAGNANGTNYGHQGSFETPPAVNELSTGAYEDVTPSGAKLTGLLSPDGSDAHYYFQYGTSQHYGSTSPELPGTDAGKGGAECEPPGGPKCSPVTASTVLSGLAANTTYHYRLVAVNKFGTTQGADATFTTTGPVRIEPAAPTGLEHNAATVNAEVYPDGFETTYQFEYGETKSYGSSIPATPTGIGKGQEPGLVQEAVPVTAALTGLKIGTTYHYRVAAVSSQGTVYEPDQTLTTVPSAPIDSEFVTELTSESARLHTQINPLGNDTTYYFQYGTQSCVEQLQTCTTVRSPSGDDLGAADTDQAGSVLLQNLSPATTYHYRVIATNILGTSTGEDRTFTTQATGTEVELPDNRQYELVSPAQKDGAEILGISGGGRIPEEGDATQASEDGRSVTYIATAPVGGNPPGNALSTQIFSTRGAGGWSSQDISIPHKNSLDAGLVGEGEEYVRLSSDLSRAVVLPHLAAPEPSLAPEVHQEVEITNYISAHHEIYVRNDLTGAFRAVVTSEPLPPVVLEGVTPDLGSVLFEGPSGLDPGYPAAGGLYEWTDGRTKLVSVLPSGQPAEGTSKLAAAEGTRNATASGEEAGGVRHAVSDDGIRVVWSSQGGWEGKGALFTRDVTTGETVQVDAAQDGVGPSGGGVFQAASSDGTRVFFTDVNELTKGASEGGLFMFDVTSGKLMDLAPGANEGGGQNEPRTQSFLGSNEAGTSLYIVAPEVLTNNANWRGETATRGMRNLYLLQEAPVHSGSWNTTFITDGAEEGNPQKGGNDLTAQASGVSPDGRYLAFMSAQNETGYDSHDANSGEPDMEVYLYDAVANKVVCASCNPTGMRPIGEYDSEGFPRPGLDHFEVWAGKWLAASIPGWPPDGIQRTTGYQPRFLSDSGRLFFDSADALVPHDVDGKDDVYEYEPEGVGGCQPPGYGQNAGVVFDRAASGCVGLISAGTGNDDSSFFDASASGNDVFFTTQDGLAPQDTDGVFDMYDAHVCTDSEPCVASPPSLPPACSTADSCRAAPSLQPGVFGAPASATFEGAGNVTPTTSAGATGKGKTKTVAQSRGERLVKALRACARKPKRKQAVCKANAKKRYGHANSTGGRIK